MFRLSVFLLIFLGFISCTKENTLVQENTNEQKIQTIHSTADFFERVKNSDNPIFDKLTQEEIEYIGNNLRFLPNKLVGDINMGEIELSLEEERTLFEAILGLPVTFDGEIESRDCSATILYGYRKTAACYENSYGNISCPCEFSRPFMRCATFYCTDFPVILGVE